MSINFLNDNLSVASDDDVEYEVGGGWVSWPEISRVTPLYADILNFISISARIFRFYVF